MSETEKVSELLSPHQNVPELLSPQTPPHQIHPSDQIHQIHQDKDTSPTNSNLKVNNAYVEKINSKCIFYHPIWTIDLFLSLKISVVWVIYFCKNEKIKKHSFIGISTPLFQCS